MQHPARPTEPRQEIVDLAAGLVPSLAARAAAYDEADAFCHEDFDDMVAAGYTAISQCPATTTRMLATRSRSANRSRSTGVAAATRWATAPVSMAMAGPRELDGVRTGPAWPPGTGQTSGFGPNPGAGGAQVGLGTSGSRAGTVRVYGGFMEGWWG